jgi:hypothetical protein
MPAQGLELPKYLSGLSRHLTAFSCSAKALLHPYAALKSCSTLMQR